MRLYKTFAAMIALLAMLTTASSCDKIDNKSVPSFMVRIDLGNYALWGTYGVFGMGDYRIFNREKLLPSNFPYNVNTYTGYGGVLLMMGMEGPMAYDLACPVEASQNVVLSINPEYYEAVCSKCGSRFNPLMGAGGPISGVAITNKVGMRTYHVYPSNGGYIIAN